MRTLTQFDSLAHLAWCTIENCPIDTIPTAMRAWLYERDSMTARMQAVAGSPPNIEVLAQFERKLDHHESPLLNCAINQRGVQREVYMYCGEELFLYGRSIFPNTLFTHYPQLKTLGTKALGSVLFNDPCIHRVSIDLAITPEQQWCRRSVFNLSDQSLLLYEVFL